MASEFRCEAQVAVVGGCALVTGYLAGFGGSAGTMGLAMLETGQRHISAVLVVAASPGGDVIVLTLVAGFVIIVGLLIIAERSAGAVVRRP